MIDWVLSLNVLSPNKAKHWSVVSRVNNQNKKKIKTRWLYESNKIKAPCVVTIQRLYNPSNSEKRWDDDNWIMGCKGVRDAIADILNPGLAPGQADHERYGIKFKYDQITAPTKGVRITIRTQEEEAYVAN